MAHITSVWSQGRTHHRIPAGLLTPTDEVRYRRDGQWFKVLTVRDTSDASVASVRVEHADGPPWVLSPAAMVDVKYLGER